MRLSQSPREVEMAYADETKIEKLGWTTRGRRGVYRDIPKGLINIDHTYQRAGINNGRVLKIAKDWSWVACSVVVVAQRPDGSYWAVDGQHRVLGARKRPDITELPCLVFVVEKIEEEAAAFVELNTMRGPVKSIDAFKAKVLAGDPVALEIDRMVRSEGYSVGKGQAEFRVGCVGAFDNLMRVDADLVRRLWPLIAEIHAGEVIYDRTLRGLFHLESTLRRRGDDQSVFDDRNRAALVKAGPRKIAQAIHAAVNSYGKGGERSYALGCLEVLNARRKSNRIEL